MRAVLVVLAVLVAPQSLAYDKWIVKFAQQYEVDPMVVRSLIFAESSKIRTSVGDDGKSFGLMQVQVPTARDMGFTGTRKQLMYPYYNIKYGTKYLRWCYDMLGTTDFRVAADAYNRGIQNVRDFPYRGKWNQHRHVKKMLKYLSRNRLTR